jgi:translation initiation factor RLI1
MCPVPKKAIAFQKVEVVTVEGETKTINRPYIVDKECIGCGICEYKCPLIGPKGVVVIGVGEQEQLIG